MKSFDIQPRRKAATTAKTPQAVPIKIRKAVLPSPAKPVSTKPPSRWSTTIVSTLGAVLVLTGVLSFLVLPEARISITPRIEPTTRDFEIRVDKNETGVNASELVVPGKAVAQEFLRTEKFTPSGVRNIGQKAAGFVYLYNFSKTTLILKAKTTVLEAGGKQYFFTQDVGNIRPTAFIGLEEQEVDQTSLIPPVPVVASEPGAEYNLPKGSRLEINNEVFGRQPKALYAAVAEDVKGGTSKTIKVVSDGDLVSAKRTVTQELTQEAGKIITENNPGFKLAENAFSSEVVEEKGSVAAGAEVPEFDFTLKLKVTALLYDEADIKDVIAERIERLLPENKVLKAESGGAESRFLNINLEQGQGLLNTHFEGQIVYKLDPEELVAKVRGRSAEEIQELLLSRPEIEAVTIKFYPFWVKSAPKFGKKIYLQISP